MDNQVAAAELVHFMFLHAHQPAIETASQVARGEGALLSYLVLHHDGATPGELREALFVGSGRIANALKHLETKQLIVRKPSEEDRRVVRVFLTPAGQAYIKEKYHRLIGHLTSAFASLNDEDVADLLRVARKLSANARAEGGS